MKSDKKEEDWSTVSLTVLIVYEVVYVTVSTAWLTVSEIAPVISSKPKDEITVVRYSKRIALRMMEVMCMFFVIVYLLI